MGAHRSILPQTSMPAPMYKRFDVYWWVASDGPELCRYRTLKAADIQQFSASHFRVIAHPIDPALEDLELILREKDGTWFVRSDSFFDIAEDYPLAFALTDQGAVWTDAQEDEIMVIQAAFS